MGCQNKENVESQAKLAMDKMDSGQLDLFFIKSDSTGLDVETILFDVKENDPYTTIGEILGRLQDGPTSAKLLPSIPEKLHILKYAYEEEKHYVNIDLDEFYNQLEPIKEVLLRASIVKSLSQLDFVEGVSFSIQGTPLMGKDGKTIGPMAADDIIIDIGEYASQSESVEILLYFANEDATALSTEKRKINVNANDNLSRYIVEELIVGPEGPNLFQTVPKETKINDIQINEGICYLDLSEEFRSKHWGGSTGELLTIYSIVNSLTELPDISKVQFLIEGEKQDTFKGHLDFSGIFERNLDIVDG